MISVLGYLTGIRGLFQTTCAIETEHPLTLSWVAVPSHLAALGPEGLW